LVYISSHRCKQVIASTFVFTLLQEFIMNIKLIAIAAVSGFAAFGAQAFQGEENPLPPQPFQSMQSRAAVQAQARQPAQISNGGTGVLVTNGGAVDRATVRANAVAAARAGSALYGERGAPM
jgi:hypothetical protein